MIKSWLLLLAAVGSLFLMILGVGPIFIWAVAPEEVNPDRMWMLYGSLGVYGLMAVVGWALTMEKFLEETRIESS